MENGTAVFGMVRFVSVLLEEFKLNRSPFDFGLSSAKEALVLLNRLSTLRREGKLIPSRNEETNEVFWRMVQDNGMSKPIRSGDYLVFFTDGHVESRISASI